MNVVFKHPAHVVLYPDPNGGDTKALANFDLLPQDVQDLLEELHTRPEMKMMFSVCKDATKEDVLEAVRIIERFKK
jgi:hypothetical protein